MEVYYADPNYDCHRSGHEQRRLLRLLRNDLRLRLQMTLCPTPGFPASGVKSRVNIGEFKR